MRFAPLNASFLNVELLVSVNFKHFWNGAMLRVRELTLVQRNDSLTVVVRHCFRPLKVFSNQDLALSLMLVSCTIRRRSKRDFIIVASALLRHSGLVKLFVCGPCEEQSVGREVRRSTRQRKPPEHFKDFVMS